MLSECSIGAKSGNPQDSQKLRIGRTKSEKPGGTASSLDRDRAFPDMNFAAGESRPFSGFDPGHGLERVIRDDREAETR